MKPIIGITCNQNILPDNTYHPFKINYSPTGFAAAIEKAGGIPMLIPIGNPELAMEYAQVIDGLLLTGGQDVSPSLYNEEPRLTLGETLPERDAIEVKLIEATLQQNKPLLGVCRGMQLINVVLGGSLYQDLPTEANITVQHIQKAQPENATHSVRVESNSHLSTIIPDGKMVNSIHHQGIKQLAPTLNAVAWSQDHIIEAYEKIDDNTSIIGIQWHPELSYEKHPESLHLFADFVQRANKRKA
ncbi:MAG: gamma-glutamyl-gamma-aminobutyrate hydrolase family protein [Aerococcaceae bacterium]|nr:gamma-glutamyl-gamma-aminobutyrate hydrolase family protein [Aerococcaceae bacterium]